MVSVAIVVTAFISPAVAGSVIGVSFAYVLAVATLVWRRFNAGFGLRVGEAAVRPLQGEEFGRPEVGAVGARLPQFRSRM